MISSWAKVKSKVRQLIPQHCYKMWIDPVELIDFKSGTVSLSSPNSFSAQRLKDNYLPVLKREFSKIGHDNIRIVFKARRDPGGGESGALPPPALPPSLTVPAVKRDRQMPLPGIDARFNGGRFLKKGHTFDDFVVGDNSQFAYSASLALARGQMNGTGMLYLLAGTGLGKSHLSRAVGHHIVTHSRSSRVYYITAEDFTNEMVFSLRQGAIESFKEKYRQQCDVLILEDVHFLSGKTATQKELALTLDYLLDADKKIIFSGCLPPDDIPKLDGGIRSRLSMGLVTEIDRPDFATRVRILKKKSKACGYTIPGEVTDYLAQELCDNVRQLESGLFGVAAKASLMKQTIDIDLTRSVLVNIAGRREKTTIDSIKRLTCQEFSVSEKEIVSGSRKQRIVKPRQIAIFLAKKYTDQPIKKIGQSFNRYHATAIYSINAIEKELSQKGVLFEQLNYLSKKIEAGRM